MATKLSKCMHKNVLWIMRSSANGEGPKVIAERFNRLKKDKGLPDCTNESMGGFIVVQKEKAKRDKKMTFNSVLTSAWTKQGLSL